MKIYIVVEEEDYGAMLLSADIDKEQAEKDLKYYDSISENHIRLAEIELTNKRLQFNPFKSKIIK